MILFFFLAAIIAANLRPEKKSKVKSTTNVRISFIFET